jgi:hypothetical protein
MNHIEAEEVLKTQKNSEAKLVGSDLVYYYNRFWDNFPYRLGVSGQATPQHLPEGDYICRTLPALPVEAVWVRRYDHKILNCITGQSVDVIENDGEKKLIEHQIAILNAVLQEYDGRL